MSRSDRVWGLVRDVLLVVLVAFVTFQALCRHVGDYYRVPSASMEPLLHGDPAAGDIVYVASMASAADCDRHDLVVVRHPEDPAGLLVKRIAAIGDDPAACFLELREGDVWLGGDRQRLEREVKDPLDARAMRVPWARWPEPGHAGGLDVSAATTRDGRLVLPALGGDEAALRELCRGRAAEGGAPSLPLGTVGTGSAVDATYLAVTGVRGHEGDDVGVFDCGMELELSGGGRTLFVLETRHEVVSFLWAPAHGAVQLWRNGEDVAEARLGPSPGGHRVEFGRLDNRLFFAVDGRPDAMLCHPRPAAWDRPEVGLPRGPRSRLYVAAVDEAVEVAALMVFRDVYYYRDRILGVPGQTPAWPVFVEPGHWFLLGDNAFDSHDSRSFGGVPAATFVGRPLFVLGPRQRHRWLDR